MRHVGDAAYDRHLAALLGTAITLLGSTGARVVVSTEPYNRRGEQPDGSLYPEDEPERVADALAGTAASPSRPRISVEDEKATQQRPVWHPRTGWRGAPGEVSPN